MMLKKMLPAVGLIGILVFASSCTSKITEEQLAQLQELRKQERVLNQQISDSKSEQMKIQNEINSRKSELNDCTKELNFIKEKLAQWPNIWPDWNPNATPAPATPEKK